MISPGSVPKSRGERGDIIVSLPLGRSKAVRIGQGTALDLVKAWVPPMNRSVIILATSLEDNWSSGNNVLFCIKNRVEY